MKLEIYSKFNKAICCKLIIIGSATLSGCIATSPKTKLPNVEKAKEQLHLAALSNIDIFKSARQLSEHGINITETNDAIEISYQTNSKNPYLFKYSPETNKYCNISQNTNRNRKVYGYGKGLGPGTPHLYGSGGKIIEYTKYAKLFIKDAKPGRGAEENNNYNSYWEPYEFVCTDYTINTDINPNQKILQPHYYIFESCTKEQIRQCHSILFKPEKIKDHAFNIAKLDLQRDTAARTSNTENQNKERLEFEGKQQDLIEINQKNLAQKSITGTSLCYNSKGSIYTSTYYIKATVEGASGSKLQMRVSSISSITPPSYTLQQLNQYSLNGNLLVPNMIFWDESLSWNFCKQ